MMHFRWPQVKRVLQFIIIIISYVNTRVAHTHTYIYTSNWRPVSLIRPQICSSKILLCAAPAQGGRRASGRAGAKSIPLIPERASERYTNQPNVIGLKPCARARASVAVVGLIKGSARPLQAAASEPANGGHCSLFRSAVRPSGCSARADGSRARAGHFRHVDPVAKMRAR